MQHTEQIKGRPEAERQRIEAVVETLANLRNRAETVAEVAHDARNMVTALGLYCDLLEEPGVLAAPYAHYGNELRLVAAASRRLVEKLVALDIAAGPQASAVQLNLPLPGDLPKIVSESVSGSLPGSLSGFGANRSGSVSIPDDTASAGAGSELLNFTPDQSRPLAERDRLWDLMPARPIDNLATELKANHNLLSSLAGTAIAVTTEIEGGAQPVRLTGEDLTRVLINLVKNACEVQPSPNRIRIALGERLQQGASWITLAIEDDGPGIPEANLDQIFVSGFTEHAAAPAATIAMGGGPLMKRGLGQRGVSRRGLGLAITRSIVEAAGGRIAAANRSQGGAVFTIELPINTR